jgi:alpha-maltose-1-phosphate synthase
VIAQGPEPEILDSQSGQTEPAAATGNKAIRVIGLYEAKMSQNPDGTLSGKLGNLYNAIGRQFTLLATESVRIGTIPNYYNLARNYKPDRTTWRASASINPWAFEQRTAIAENFLEGWDGKFDVIVQLHTLYAPGELSRNRPFVLVTDNTYLNSLRYWPEWVPATSTQMRQEWLELETSVYKAAKNIFTWSEFTRQSFINDYKIPADRVITIGAGANLLQTDISDKRYDTQTAIFVGYEFERKGGFYLLEAWKQVTQKLPQAKLYIAGPQHPLADDLQGVHWLGRISDRNFLSQKLYESTVFVMPSLFEPYGHAFTEGMGMGLGAIGADHCAMPEIIEHGQNGLLVSPRDINGLAEALIEVLSNPDYAAQLGHAAYETIKNSRTWDDVVMRMAPSLHQITGK